MGHRHRALLRHRASTHNPIVRPLSYRLLLQQLGRGGAVFVATAAVSTTVLLLGLAIGAVAPTLLVQGLAADLAAAATLLLLSAMLFASAMVGALLILLFDPARANLRLELYERAYLFRTVRGTYRFDTQELYGFALAPDGSLDVLTLDGRHVRLPYTFTPAMVQWLRQDLYLCQQIRGRQPSAQSMLTTQPLEPVAC